MPGWVLHKDDLRAVPTHNVLCVSQRPRQAGSKKRQDEEHHVGRVADGCTFYFNTSVDSARKCVVVLHIQAEAYLDSGQHLFEGYSVNALRHYR